MEEEKKVRKNANKTESGADKLKPIAKKESGKCIDEALKLPDAPGTKYDKDESELEEQKITDEDLEMAVDTPLIKVLVRSMYALQKMRIQVGNRIYAADARKSIDENTKKRLIAYFSELYRLENAMTKEVGVELMKSRLFSEFLQIYLT